MSDPSPLTATTTRTRALRLTAQIANQVCAASIVTPEATFLTSPRAAVKAPPRRTRTGGKAPRRSPPVSGPICAIIVLAGIFAAGLGLENVAGTAVLPPWMAGGGKPPPRDFPVMEKSEPVDLTVPSLNLQALVHDVGLAPDGTIAVPDLERRNEAGWYEQSPTPGENGPALLVGHVDSRTGPSVFHNVDKLRPGEKIEISRRDRSTAVFEVNSVERFGKDNLPVKRIYREFSHPGLRLITCGGAWVGGETGYADNVVVFASLVSARTR